MNRLSHSDKSGTQARLGSPACTRRLRKAPERIQDKGLFKLSNAFRTSCADALADTAASSFAT